MACRAPLCAVVTVSMQNNNNTVWKNLTLARPQSPTTVHIQAAEKGEE